MASVATAPAGQQMRTFFQEGFGILGGAFGTHLGSLAGLGIVAILGIGPFGLFVTVFVCASAGGILGMELFKGFGGQLYDYYEPKFNTGKIYHSPEQFFWEAVK